MDSSPFLELLDWRRHVAELFAALRSRTPDAQTLSWFRAEKDTLYRTHPQSPIPASERVNFRGLAYWPYDPEVRVTAQFTARERKLAGQAEDFSFSRIGALDFTLHEQPHRLVAFWIDGYAGGLFVPFRDATSGSETYGAGRYLVDSIKSADLGSDLARGTVILDFNYAYHPSCVYDPRWICPLAPPDSRLTISIRAGERLS
ncbi:MAG TPA: DUF1684 domain-containing protein [Chloroflexota bacterium]